MEYDKTTREWARTTLKTAGLRATPARVATLIALRNASSPLTHAEVTESLSEHGFDKATVFRNLNDMASVNILNRSELGDHVWRFEIATGGGHTTHPHFVCIDCGTVVCVEELELTKKSKSVSQQVGQVTEILLRGHCHDCV